LRPRPKSTRSFGEPPTHELDAESESKGKPDDDEAEEIENAASRLVRRKVTDKLDPALVRALEQLAQAAIDATPHIAGSGRDWRPHTRFARM